MKKKIQIPILAAFLLLSLSSVFTSVYIIAGNGAKNIGMAALVISLLAIAVISVYLVISENNNLRYIAKMSRDLRVAQRETLYNFPAPVLIVDKNRTVIWVNDAFSKQLFSESESFGLNISELFMVNFDMMFHEQGTIVRIHERYFVAKAVRPENDPDNFAMIFLNDETEFKNLQKEHTLSHPSVLIISVDNYDDALQNSRASEKSTIVGEIERLVEDFVDSTTGIAVNISSSRFVVVLEERHLQKCIENKFDILDKARSILVGKSQPITLSIGVGKDAKTLSQSEAYARQALDMCLGRGGDQVAIKTDNGFEFIGGMSKGFERRTKVRSRVIAAAILEVVKDADVVFVMGHRNGDLDSIGSATGLTAAFRQKGKQAYVVCDTEHNLASVMISHINASENSVVYISPQAAMDMKTEQSILVIVDTHNPDILDSTEFYRMFNEVIVIDHHRRMVNAIENAVVFYNEPNASSASEMVTEIVSYFSEDMRLSPHIAESLLAGIMLDTKNFVFKTGVRTFEAAAYLRRQGADTTAVKTMFATPIDTYREKSKLINEAELYGTCAIADGDGDNDAVRLAAAQAADELLGISGIKASFVLYESNAMTAISARSMGDVNVQVIMEAFGGGGHHNMAGAQVNMNLFDAKEKLKDVLRESVSGFSDEIKESKQ